ncbi:hypothetical protein SARC_08520 [Sphaeroforma arctica JP610]|uniref:Uncharacterized protein n=1 Tax=Sphaeroforma arctica JP610 TaxID=667725 RepID=A0A0L0FQN7_9EUKA|nr:hypothetical protein SARC_08520 [Sphaeroforma arctica JP610]KNC79075.1 hypothetical protein SARC_08520 [Sphaeroforma arctica JP610]|eukprot:XP_014152977.1 hypothetical protein SARC_08520 [Sphaeroforma arctica JP610]
MMLRSVAEREDLVSGEVEQNVLQAYDSSLKASPSEMVDTTLLIQIYFKETGALDCFLTEEIKFYVVDVAPPCRDNILNYLAQRDNLLHSLWDTSTEPPTFHMAVRASVVVASLIYTTPETIFNMELLPYREEHITSSVYDFSGLDELARGIGVPEEELADIKRHWEQ